MSKRNIEAIYPLSPQQQGMLFGTQIAAHSGLYVEQEVHALEGPLNPAAFVKAWESILERHSILRTLFIWKNQQQPVQVVIRKVEVPLEQQDWSLYSPGEQQKRLAAFLEEDRHRGFDLSKAPLMRLALLRVSDATYQFVWTIHHILIDGWCRPVIFKELTSFYQKYCQGDTVSVERSRPYGDYISWLQRQDFSQAEAFWRKYLENFNRTTPLGKDIDPIDREPPVERFGYKEGRISVATATKLQALLRQHHVTANTLIQGIWAVLLSHYGESDEVVFGTTVSGRPPELEGTESMIGLFVTTLPFRVKVSGETPLWSWLRKLQDLHLQLRHYEYCSPGQIHQWSDMSGAQPLYESLLVFENYPTGSSQQNNWNDNAGRPSSHFVGAQTTYPLTFLVAAAFEVTILAIHDRRRIDETGVACMVNHFLRLLEAISSDSIENVASLRRLIPDQQVPLIVARSRVPSQSGLSYYEAPDTPVEEIVTRIAGEVLGLKQVGVNDNFFWLGGHSLLATQLVSRLRDTFQIELPLSMLFENITLRELALAIEDIIAKEISAMTDEEAQRMIDCGYV